MKVIIWLLCGFVYSLVKTLLNIYGITLGGIPTAILAGITMYIASNCCKIWDEEKEAKAAKKQFAQQKNNHSFDWQCSCGIRHQKYETSCICGKTKKEILASNVTEEAIDVAASNQEEFAVTPDKMCFCRKCGEKLVENSNFCGKCGTEIIKE